MKRTIKSIAALAMLAVSAPAFAGGVVVAQNGDSKLKFETEVFSDLTQVKTTHLTPNVDTKKLGLSVSRAYFTGKYSFNNDWMMRVTTDVVLTDAVNAQGNVVKKNNNIFLKYAYLQGKLYGDAVVLRLGQSHTPWIDHEEHLWAHRYISPVLIDSNHYDASSDLGIGFKGKVLDGLANYWFTYTNGRGYDHPKITGSTMDFDSRIGLNLLPGLTLDFQYRNGYKGTKQTPQPAATIATKSVLYQTMATYGMGHDFRIGANYAQNTVTPRGGIKVKDTAYSLWGWGKVTDQFGALARYEYVKNDKLAATQKKNTRYVAGVEYFPTKNVAMSLVYDVTNNKIAGLWNPTKGKVTKIGLYTNFKY